MLGEKGEDHHTAGLEDAGKERPGGCKAPTVKDTELSLAWCEIGLGQEWSRERS